MDGINWPEVLAGFGVGLLPLAARQLYIVLKYSRLPGRRKYLGSWWAYHRSTTGSGAIYERHLDVRYSLISGRLTVRAHEDQIEAARSSQLQYSGEISTRQGMVRYVSLKDAASHERLSWYIFDPFFDPVEETIGLYLSLDLRGLPSAGALMISRNRVPLAEMDERLDRHVVKVSSMLDPFG